MITQVKIIGDKLTYISHSIRGEGTRENLATVRANLGAKTFVHRQAQRAKIEAANSLTVDRSLLRATKRLLAKNK